MKRGRGERESAPAAAGPAVESTTTESKRPKRSDLTGGLARVVGWATWEEWRMVRAWLGSNVPEEQQRGLRRIRAWRARAPVPLAIEATASLLETHAMDTFPPTRTTYELRLLYSMAIVRMVNGLVEVEQKGTFARSVWGIAERLGIPRVLVDLRHTATHNELPSLASLRIAAAQALEWLDSNYWQQQEDALTRATNRTREILQQYAQLKTPNYVVPARVPLLPASLESETADCIKTLLETTNSNSVREVLVPMLVNSFIVPVSAAQWKKVGQKEREERWDPLLLACVRHWGHFFGTLLATITDEIVKLSSSTSADNALKTKRIKALLLWLRHLLYEPSYQNLIHECSIKVPATALLQAAVRHTSRWTKLAQRLIAPWLPGPGVEKRLTTLMTFTRRDAGARRRAQQQQPTDGLSLEVFEGLLDLIKQRGISAVAGTAQPAVGGGSGDAATQGPWQRCTGWTPCSVGLGVMNDMPNLLLPRELDYNGAITLAPLERPVMPLVALPYSGVPQPASQGPSRTSGDDEDDDDEEDEEKEEVAGSVKPQRPLTTAERNAAQAAAAAAAAAVDVDEPSSTPAPATTTVTPAAALLFSPMELTRL